MTVGLGLLAAGCSHPPAARRPAAVYVSAQALVQDHPQWKDVVAMDRQIAFLRGYAVSLPPQVIVAAVRLPKRAPEPGTSNVALLKQAISDRLNDAYTLQKGALEARLARQHTETRAAVVLATRNALSAAAAAQLQKILSAHGLKIQDMGVRLEAYDSLLRTYAARGWDPKNLPADRQAVATQIAAENALMQTEMTAVLDGLVSEFAKQAGAEVALALRSRQANNEARDTLIRVERTQEKLLLDALTNIGVTGTRRPAPADTADAAGHVSIPPASAPDMLPLAASLEGRRTALAAFILRNTQAVVRSTAARRGLRVEFLQLPGVPDRTEAFRGAVRAAPTP